MNALGRVYLEMYALSGRGDFRKKAEGLAKYFKDHMRLKRNGSYEWDYWPRTNYEKVTSRFVEDVTHAQINLSFAVQAFQNGLVFDPQDMERLTATFLENIVREEGDWASTVGGEGSTVAAGTHEGLTGWIVLDEFDPHVAITMDEFLERNTSAFPLGWFSYATGPLSFAHLMQPAKR